MITERDLQEAIAACQGERNPNANTCVKFAAFYTIRNELFRKPEQPAGGSKMEIPTYSYAAAPADTADTHIDYNSGTDFSQAIDGRDSADIWPIMDELMSTLQAIHPRLYNAVMRRLKALQ